MISIFGIISVLVAFFSIAAIVLHNRVMSKRTPVDTYLTQLEDLLRDRLVALYHLSPHDSELHDLCDQYMDLDLSAIAGALPDIHRASKADLHINAPEEWEAQESSDRLETLAQNAEAIQETAAALNQAIQVYNGFITGRPPMAAMAYILGLTVEEPITYPFE